MTLALEPLGMADPARAVCTYHRQPGPHFADEIARSYEFKWIKATSEAWALLVLRLDGSEVARLMPESGVDAQTLAWRWAEADALKNSPPPWPAVCGPFEVVP